MKPPAYSWICHACGIANKANTDTCAQCGFGAVATAKEIEKAQARKSQSTFSELGAYVLVSIVVVPVLVFLKVGAMSLPIWIVVPLGLIAIAIWIVSKAK